MNALASSLLLFISKPFMMLRFSLNNKLELLQRISFFKATNHNRKNCLLNFFITFSFFFLFIYDDYDYDDV